MANYDVLESARETTVMCGDSCIAVFYGYVDSQAAFVNGSDRARRFVKREEYLEQVYAARDIPDSLLASS